MSSSLVRKNLSGAFLGGFVGILSARYVHPVMGPPFGALVGGLLGYFHDVVINSISFVCSLVRRTCRWAGEVWRSIGPVRNPPEIGRAYHTAVRAWWDDVRQNRPHQLLRILRTISLIIVVGIAAVWNYRLMPFAVIEKTPTPLEWWLGYVVSTVLWALLACLLVRMPCEAKAETWWSEPLRNPRKVLKRFKAQGPVEFVIREALWIAAIHFPICMLMFPGFAYFVVAFFCMAGLTLVPYFGIKGAFRATHCLAVRFPQLICLGVTGAVTMISAWVFSASTLSPTALWLLALFTGVVAGVAAESVRNALLGQPVAKRVYHWVVDGGLEALTDRSFSRLGQVVNFPWRFTIGFNPKWDL